MNKLLDFLLNSCWYLCSRYYAYRQWRCRHEHPPIVMPEYMDHWSARCVKCGKQVVKRRVVLPTDYYAGKVV